MQRVKRANVGSAKIGEGLLVLLGIKKDDSEKDAEQLATKLSRLRVMADENGKMNLSVAGVGGSVLVVSQFTLHADTSGGNRPSFIDAEEPEKAKKLYELFIEKLRANGIEVQTGTFGNYMRISAVLDGPVTILYLD